MVLKRRVNRLRRKVVLACAIGATGLLLAGCSVFGFGGTDPHLYDTVDAVIEELHLEAIGEVVYEGHYGTGGFSSTAPTAQVIVELRTPPETLDQTISELGFTKDSKRSWERGSGESLVTVTVVIVDPGELLKMGDGTEIKIANESALVHVTS